MHLERSSTSSSDAPCTIAAGQKDLGTIRMAISSAQGTLRATAQLDLYLYLGRQWHRLFSLICSLFGGFSFLCPGVIFIPIRIAQTSCVHTLLPFHFFLPTLHQYLNSWRSFVNYGWKQGTFVFPRFLCAKKDASHLGWVAHKSNQLWRSLTLHWTCFGIFFVWWVITSCDINHYYFLFGNDTLGLREETALAALQLVTRFQWPKETIKKSRMTSKLWFEEDCFVIIKKR